MRSDVIQAGHAVRTRTPWAGYGRRGLLWLAAVLLLLRLPALAAQAQHQNYIVGPRDVLTVAVWAEPTLSGRFTVEADGTFTYPLIGRVNVANLTLKEIEQQLTSRLGEGLLKNPQVAVSIEQHASQMVFVVGEVRQPGSYPLNGDTTLMAILARAGSTAPTAAGEIVVVRPSARPGGAASPSMPDQEGAAEVLRIDMSELHTSALAQRLLQNGDTVYVPRAETAYVFGQVRNPGAYPVQKNTTVLQALSLAGGLTERGSSSRVTIVRVMDGKPSTLKVKLTDLVRAGDTVVVAERFF
jgi:polysaccharide export outer membrane protein